MSERAVRSHIRGLVKRGLIRGRQCGPGSNRYEFLWHEMFGRHERATQEENLGGMNVPPNEDLGRQDLSPWAADLGHLGGMNVPPNSVQEFNTKNSEAASEESSTDRQSAPLASPLPLPDDDEPEPETAPIDDVRRWMASTAERMATNAGSENPLGYPDRAIAKRFLDGCGGTLDAVEAVCRTLGDRKLTARSWGWFVAAAREPRATAKPSEPSRSVPFTQHRAAAAPPAAPAPAREPAWTTPLDAGEFHHRPTAEPTPPKPTTPTAPTPPAKQWDCERCRDHGSYPDQHYVERLCTCPRSQRESVRQYVAEINAKLSGKKPIQQVLRGGKPQQDARCIPMPTIPGRKPISGEVRASA